jgi:hypothetical protein
VLMRMDVVAIHGEVETIRAATASKLHHIGTSRYAGNMTVYETVSAAVNQLPTRSDSMIHPHRAPMLSRPNLPILNNTSA